MLEATEDMDLRVFVVPDDFFFFFIVLSSASAIVASSSRSMESSVLPFELLFSLLECFTVFLESLFLNDDSCCACFVEVLDDVFFSLFVTEEELSACVDASDGSLVERVEETGTATGT